MSSTTNTGAATNTGAITTTTGTATPITSGVNPPNASMGSVFGSLTPMLLILVVFYFLVMRPQQKREAKRQEMINAVKRGDRVVTNSGVIGTVHKVISEKEISLQIADDVRIRILRSAIGSVLDKNSDLGKNFADMDEEDSSKRSSHKKGTSSLEKKSR